MHPSLLLPMYTQWQMTNKGFANTEKHTNTKVYLPHKDRSSHIPVSLLGDTINGPKCLPLLRFPTQLTTASHQSVLSKTFDSFDVTPGSRQNMPNSIVDKVSNVSVVVNTDTP